MASSQLHRRQTQLCSSSREPIETVAPEREEASTSGQEEASMDENKPGVGLQPAMWAFYAAYMVYLTLLPSGPFLAPGAPVYAMKGDAVKQLLDLSFNFFLIPTGLNAAGIHVVEAPVVHPINEGLFNFVIAWAIMFGPLLIKDGRKITMKTKELFLLGMAFITNIFAIPYMAHRLGRPTTSVQLDKPSKQDSPIAYSIAKFIIDNQRVLGASMLGVGIFMVYWSFFGRPEFGGIEERLEYLKWLVTTDRVMYAFVTDVFLFSIFQGWLIQAAAKGFNGKPNTRIGLGGLAYVPFLGLGLSLILAPQDETST